MPKCLARGTCFSALRGRHRRRRRDLRRASPLRGTQSLFPWHSDACSTMASRRRARGARCATSSWLLPWLACATALVALQPIYRFNFIKLAGSYSLGTPYHPSPTCHLNCFTEFSWVTITLFSFCYGENCCMYNGTYFFWKLNLNMLYGVFMSDIYFIFFLLWGNVQWGIFVLEVKFEAVCMWKCRRINKFLSQILEIWK